MFSLFESSNVLSTSKPTVLTKLFQSLELKEQVKILDKHPKLQKNIKKLINDKYFNSKKQNKWTTSIPINKIFEFLSPKTLYFCVVKVNLCLYYLVNKYQFICYDSKYEKFNQIKLGKIESFTLNSNYGPKTIKVWLSNLSNVKNLFIDTFDQLFILLNKNNTKINIDKLYVKRFTQKILVKLLQKPSNITIQILHCIN